MKLSDDQVKRKEIKTWHRREINYNLEEF